MKIVPPKELSASRLVALTKPNGKVRPIAIGEAIYRLMSSVIFNRVSTKAKEYFSPFQYGIKTIDRASVAALSSDLFFNCHENSCIFNLDFKNAFNSVKRDSIWKEIKSNFPELEDFFFLPPLVNPFIFHFLSRRQSRTVSLSKRCLWLIVTLILIGTPKQRFYQSDQAHPFHFPTLPTIQAMLEIHFKKIFIQKLIIVPEKTQKNHHYVPCVLLRGKAAGPSGISFDLLKIACSSAPEIADDLAHYFQQLIVLKINPPFELLAARLIALVKPGNGIKPDGIRPIAVGESLSRLQASIVFDRVKDKASTFLNPHQFGIKTIDGASVAAIPSDTFFNAEENNFIFNLDFKNAFNSVKREAIFEVIKSDFPELSSFFYHFYGKESDLIFNSFALKSSSGVKQGDPLGPLLFCLAIHKTLNIIKQKYPSIKIVAYMDDISLIGSFDLLELVAQEIADSYENIGLHLNASKCLLIGSSAQDLVINDSIVPFTNYSSDAF
ncbi:hypothetical protein P9112_004968 [Eukaryota sp. TZLM1-RC]